MSSGVDEAIARIRAMIAPGGEAAETVKRLADRDHTRGGGVA
jgi:hypothetical protein